MDDSVSYTPMQIRPATTTDRQAILTLMRTGDYNRIRLKPACFLVAEERGEIVGIGQVKQHWDGTPELASLVVAAAQRRQGIGGALVQALVARHFTHHPVEPLYLFCLSTLEPYYQRFGFRRVERRRLPWPLWTMHFLGNGLGRLAGHFQESAFTVIAMQVEQRAANATAQQP
jgi:N-acetylglutamate synthase-like GNAT family acetyltransferase